MSHKRSYAIEDIQNQPDRKFLVLRSDGYSVWWFECRSKKAAVRRGEHWLETGTGQTVPINWRPTRDRT